MRDEIMVSIYCLAYNHEKYIRNAIEGFLSQKTNFKYEVIIHDDASTDETANIIREYQEKYPEIIKPIYQIENQYSKGRRIYTEHVLPKVRGKYIALCEGDDYWIDDYKLQKQVDAMEKNKDVDICAHKTFVMNAETNEMIDTIEPMKGSGVLTQEQVISLGGGCVGTCSLMYRAEIDKDIPQFRYNMELDYAIQIHGALRGGMLYLDEGMSVYRWMVPGSWSSTQCNRERQRKFAYKLKEMYETLDVETGNVYYDVIRHRELVDIIPCLCGEIDFRKHFWYKYGGALKRMSIRNRIASVIKVYFPISMRIKQKLIR